MRTLASQEIAAIGGSNALDSTTGSFVSGNGQACATAMLAWGGLGSGVGAFGGAIGFFGGMAAGGWYASSLPVCGGGGGGVFRAMQF